MPSSEWKKSSDGVSYRGDRGIDFQVGLALGNKTPVAALAQHERRRLTWEAWMMLCLTGRSDGRRMEENVGQAMGMLDAFCSQPRPAAAVENSRCSLAQSRADYTPPVAAPQNFMTA